jgi:quercetin dioxygenase-like cupin family protein
MTHPLVKPGETVDVRQLATVAGTRQSVVLVKTANVEIIHSVVPAGETIPTHEAAGEMVLHCLEGRASVSAIGKTMELTTGQLLYLSTNEPFSILGIERASVIVTVIAPQQGPAVELIGDQEGA